MGDAPPQYGNEDWQEEPYVLPEHLVEVASLAEAVLVLNERLDELYEDDDAQHEDDEATNETEPAAPPAAIVSVLRELSKATLELAVALEEDEEALHELDEWSQGRELLPRILALPLGLVAVGELESALAVARAFTFVAAESCNADIAIIFAESGKREEAVAQLEANLKQFPESWLTAMKSGEAFEALGDAAAAEASYRRAMILGEDETDQEEATSMLAELLEDMGRFEERDELLSATIDGEPDGLEELVSLHSASLGGERRVDAKPAPLAAVGRNEPCPCGSGMKYKKCHGA